MSWRTRLGPWEWAFAAVCVAAAALLLILGRSTTFWLDDWALLSAPHRDGWTLDTLMLPHNDHWVLTQMALWELLQSTVGMRSHLPYLALNVPFHIAAGAAVFVLVRGQAGPFIGFAAGTLFLFLGTGGEVLFFATGFSPIVATALGSWALVATLGADPLQRAGGRRAITVAALLVLAIMSGGMALYYMAAIGAALLFVADRRRELWVLLPAGLAFVAWEIAYGTGAGAVNVLTDIAALRDLGEYVRAGSAHALGAVTGLEDSIGLVLVVLLVGATAWNLLGRGPIVFGAVAGVTGLIAAYAITGLARASAGPDQAAASRYVYATAPLVLLAVSAWLARLAPFDPRRMRVGLTVAVFLAVALTANLVQLRGWHRFFSDRANETIAAAAILLEYGGTPALPAEVAPTPSEDLQIANLPSPQRLRTVFARDGSPLDDPLADIPETTAEMAERALLRLVAPRFLIEPIPVLPDGVVPPALSGPTDLTLTVEGACHRAVATGPAPAAEASVAQGGQIYVVAEGGGPVSAELARSPDPPVSVRVAGQLPAAGVAAVSVPDLEDGTEWIVRLELPASGDSLICASAPGTRGPALGTPVDSTG
jgi:hypothetical protein